MHEAPERIGEIVEAIQILAHSPLIGRKVKGGKRELVIGQASRGYGALYRHVSEFDIVFVPGASEPARIWLQAAGRLRN